MSRIERFFAELAARGHAALSDWPLDDELWRYGLEADGDRVVPAGRRDPLDAGQVRAALSARAAAWLRRLDVFPVIGSTNAELMTRAATASVDGHVCLAELQLAGRGRRGRGWFSPFGANLALTLGKRVDRPPASLGGASLVVGLAVLDALEQLGVPGLTLKWPNDLLLGGAKLGGILIELGARPQTELVAGIGLNVALPARIRAELPREVTDLSSLADPPGRNGLAARIVSSTVELLDGFEQYGFDAFQAAFDERHHHHGRVCRVLQGDRQITGTVVGVTRQGELMLETADGPRVFSGGEVSLRA